MLNEIVIMGRLARDPELRVTGNGISVVSFTLAVERDVADKETGKRECDFIDCVAWRKTGEFVCKHFVKGQMAIAAGRLQIRSWTDKDGNKRRSAEILANNVYFGDSKKDREGAESAGPSAGAYASPAAPIPEYGGGYGSYAPITADDANFPY